MERANSTIKTDYLSKWDIKHPKKLSMWLQKAVEGYNNRIHYALKYEGLPKMTPIQFEAYIKEIATQNRPILKIFTYEKAKVDLEEHGQLSLFGNY